MADGTDFLEILNEKAPTAEAPTTFGSDLPPAKGEEGQPKPAGDAPVADKAPSPELQKVLDELAEQRKFNGRLTTELGELRKQVRPQDPVPKPQPAELPPAPLRDKFDTDEAWQAAMSGWIVESNKVIKTTDAKASEADTYEKAWKDSGLTDEQIEETIAFWQNPNNASPLKLRAAMESLQDPKKDLRETMEKLQKLALREGMPTTSGLTPASGVTQSGDMSMDEVASFNKVMNLPTIHAQEAAIKVHEKKFGRFIKPR